MTPADRDSGAKTASPMTSMLRSPEVLARWRDYPWELVHEAPQPPYLHMALDEVLLDAVAAGRRAPSLRIWEWSAGAIVLGRFQSVRNEVDEGAAERQGLVITRRITGGGAMFVVPGNVITYSVYAPEALVKGMSFADSYAFLDAWVVEALQGLGVNAQYKPLNDLSSDQGKIGGAAQTRKLGAVLHHVTMAYDHNTAAMLEVLRIGKEKLSDKGTVSADKRVTPLRQQTQLPRERVTEAFIDTFRARHGLSDGGLEPAELAEAERLVEQKFATKAWVHLLP